MEEIVSFEDGTSAYVNDHDVVPTTKRKSNTSMYAVICIDSKFYQCIPSDRDCRCCAFFDNREMTCSCHDFPCFSDEREDGKDCVFIEVVEESCKITTDNLKKSSTYRFRL